MKKFFTIIGFVLISGFSPAQGDARFYNTEGEYKAEQAALDPGTGGGIGGEDAEAAPIDDYLPVLLLAGMAMAAYYARKKQLNAGS